MKRIKVGLFAILGALVVATPFVAKADSVPAIAGASFLASEATCFATPGFSGKVSNSACSGGRSWLIPMTLSFTGNTVFRASAAGSGTSPTCRAVLRNPGDTQVALGAATAIVGTDIGLGTFSVPSVNTTGHVDCLLQQGTRGMTAVRWNTN